jgi:hypothetical protein
MGMQMMYRLVLSATMFTTLLTGSVLFPHVAHAATYYVATNGSDSNPGSQVQPFRTINKGLKVLASGDTLYIRGGKYNEAINPVTGAIPNGGGSWATATIIAGYPGETVTLAPTAGSSVIKLGSGGGFNYMIFDNLELDGTAMGSCGGCGEALYLGGDSHHIRFSNCNIHNGPSHNIFGGGSFNEFINNRVHDSRAYGWYWSGNNTIFDGNEVYNQGGYGYHIYNTGATDVSDNIVRNSRIYNNGFGSNSSGFGLIVSHGTNNQVYNNFVYGNLAGVQIDHSCVDCKAYYNTIYGNTASGISIAEVHPESTTGSIVRNNIVYGNRSAIIHVGDPGAVIDHNFTSDPQFVNPSAGDFHLKSGSPAKTASDTGGEVGAYGNIFPGPHLRLISVTP